MDREQEAALIERAQAGDEQAWSELWEQFKNLVWKWAIRFESFGYDLDDCVSRGHEAFLHAVRTFDAARNCRLITILHRRIGWNIDRAYRGGAVHLPYTRRGRPAPYAPLEPQFRIIGSAAEHALDREQQAMLEVALESIDPRKRQILQLRMDGLKFREIAERLGVSHERVRQLLGHAIDELQGLCRAAG